MSSSQRHPPGRFVVFEGGEGSGKSTQAERLATRLGAVFTREPGGTRIGVRLRALLLDSECGDLQPRAEALLLAADRAQHVAEVVRPALDRGCHVVSDRYVGSTLAYQGWGRGLDLAGLGDLARWATEGLQADLVVLLDIDPEVAAGRLIGAGDRIEQAGRAFHRRVADGYRAMAAADPDRWVVIAGGDPADRVTEAVWAAVTTRLCLSPDPHASLGRPKGKPATAGP